MENLPEVHIQDKDGRWHKCQPFVAMVKGGRAVIYTTADGIELKREPLARYKAREARINAGEEPEDLEDIEE